MKKSLMCLCMPKEEYVGGIAVIVKKYLNAKLYFAQKGIEVQLLDAGEETTISDFLNKLKIISFFSVITQKNCVKERIKNCDNVILHMHTSREWTLLKDMFIARAVRKVFKGKMVLSIHFAEIDKILYKNNLLAKYQLRTIKKVFDKVIFLSKETQKEFVKAGVEESKTKVLYTFHNFDYDAPTIKEEKEPLQLLFVGSIDRRKGIIDLLNVLKSIDKNTFKLHICGQLTDSSIKEEYEALLGELGDNAVFHGYVSGNEKEEIFRNADVLVLPSYGEGMPIVIMEALASGCAVISTTVGAIPEIIFKENGSLVTPGDRTALKSSILSFINDRETLNNIKLTNYEYGKNFNLENNINELCSIYEEE